MSDRRIRLHIERIVLHGVDPGDKKAFASAVRAELGRLLAAPGLETPVHGRVRSRVDGGTVGDAGKPAQLGRAVAGAVLKGVTGR